MVTSALPSLLLRSGVVTRQRLNAAERRRAIYGGALDTVLLEMAALDESTLAASLAQAVGLPAPLPERLIAPDPDAHRLMATSDARRLRAAPLGRRDGVLELALHPDADRAAVAAWAEAGGARIEPFVVPEVRFHELLAVIYAEALPARYCALLGRMVGAEWARRRAGAIPRPVPAPPVDTGPSPRPPPAEYEIDIVEEAAPDLDSLLRQTRASGQGEALDAIGSLVEMRVPAAVPLLIELIADDRRAVADAARTALHTLTRQDFGDSRRAWVGWWQKARTRHRMEWLLEALAHKRADLRLAAAEELQAATGVYFGYHFDLPERDRDEARRRWADWWRTTGKEQFTGSKS
jgi:hypothetical protein